MHLPLKNRSEAGRLLAERLLALHLPRPLLVVALPRGGVQVGAPVAQALGAPLDLCLVRKIGLPWQPEVALAAVVDGQHPEVVVDDALLAVSEVEPDYIESQAVIALREIARRREVYLHGRAALAVQGHTVIVVDDGIATGTTMRAALQALRRQQPQRLILGVPVAPQQSLDALAPLVDQLICLATPEPFDAIGQFYADFHQLGDDEVLSALDAAAAAIRKSA